MMHRSFIALLPFAVGALVSVAGCSDGGGTQAAPVDREDFPAKLAQAYCDNIAKCCSNDGTPYDSATCVQNANSYFATALADEQALHATYNAQAAGDCAAAYGPFIATCGRSNEAAQEEFSHACDDIFVGTLKQGEPCTSSSECAGEDATCREQYDAAGNLLGEFCTTYEPRPHGKFGDDCYMTCDDADGESWCKFDPLSPEDAGTACYTSDGLWCDGISCKALGHAGDACGYQGCVDGLFCDEGTCAPPHDAGQACVSYEDDQCVEGTICDPIESVCTPPKKAGELCESSSECESHFCGDGGICDGPAVSANECSGFVDD